VGTLWQDVKFGVRMLRKAGASRLSQCSHLRWGSVQTVRFSPFGAPSLVARGVRILQDFAGLCRGKCQIFFVFRVSGLTHNMLVVGSSPTGPTSVSEFSRADCP
jgi:hypothetical protein